MAKKKSKESENCSVGNSYIDIVPSGGGRPKKILNQIGLDLVEKLSQFMATDEEIASALSDKNEKITVDTLLNDNNKESFLEYKIKGQSHGKTSLRSWQFATAKKGNPTMQIWLGRQYLGQTDKREYEDTSDRNITINVSTATPDDAEGDDEE